MSKLRFDITSGSTSLTLDTIDSIPGSGFVQIGSEVMRYDHRGDIFLFDLTRGVNGTTAASHTAGTTVTFLPAVPDVTTLPGPVSLTEEYGAPRSHQSVSSDMTVDAAAGSGTSTNPKYIATAMFNLFGDALTRAANYLAGVIGAYSVTGVKATTYPSGAVLAQITDGVTDVDGAVVAYIDGDSAQTKAGAAFTVRNNNTIAGSGFAFGLDLKGPAHDGYPAVAYLTGEIRFSNGTKVTVSGDTVVFTNAAGNKSFTVTMS